MTRYSKALGVVASIAIFASCSGGSGGVSNAPFHAPATYKTAKLRVKFAVPSKSTMAKRTPQLAKTYAAGKASGSPHFVGIATTEIDITLTAINGSPPGTTEYNSIVYTNPSGTTNPSCARSTHFGYACQTILVAPSATDTYNVSALWCPAPNADGSCPGTPTLISQGNFSVTVPPGGGGNANLTLDPVVGSIDWAPASSYYTGLETWTNGPAAPTISGTSYVCPGGGCYDPLLNAAAYTGYGGPLPATPTWDYLALVEYDANGDIIIPSYGSSFNHPVFLTAAGAVDAITISCVKANSTIDPDVQLVNYDAYQNPYPSPVPTGFLVNGFTGSAAAMNAPPGVSGATTDLDGNAITAVPDNTYSVNFDGGSNSYTGSSLDHCTATDSSTPPIVSSDYYVGFAFGTVVVINGRHAGSRKH